MNHKRCKKKELDALKGSIKKWEKILYEGGIDVGRFNCPLCKQYCCAECPISESVGDVNCRNTPYEDWAKHHNKEHDDLYKGPFKMLCPKCHLIALSELEFLENLLKDYEEKK